MLLATRCPACSTVGPAPCAACIAQMGPSAAVSIPPGLDACRALLDYAGPARQVVAQLKYRNARSAAAWLATGVAGLVRPGEVDLVTWAPTTELRRRSRGFDHAEILAREMEDGALLDRGGPDALRLFAAVVRSTNRDAFGEVGHA